MADFEGRDFNRGKFFCSSFLIRLILITLFLSVLPLFTSEAPDFISNTFFAKIWELVHLFIIGILVSYGLFARRKTQTHSSPALNTPNLLHASSIFNFEHQNPSGYGNQCGNEYGNQACEFRPYGLEPTVVVKPGTFDLDIGPLDLPVRSLRSRVAESESEDFASESETEVNASSCGSSIEDNESENLEKDEMDSSPTPWNWPNSVENSYLSSPGTKCKPGNSADSESPTRDVNLLVSQPMSSKSSPVIFNPKEYQEMKNVNPGYSRSSSSKGSSPFSPSLSGSPTSLKSRFTRIDFNEKAANVSLPVEDQSPNLLHSHSFRSPESEPSMGPSSSDSQTGDMQTGSRKRHHSQSFRSPLCNFMPPSLSEFPSLCSTASTVSGSQTTLMENLQREIKQVDNVLPSKSVGLTSQISRKRENTQIEDFVLSPVPIEHERKTLSRMSNSGRFSCGSFFDRDLWRGSKGETKEITKKGKDDADSNSGKCRWDCLTLDVKPSLTKSTVKGKSVRTVRPQAITLGPSLTNENTSQERVRERQEVVIISIGISEKNAKNQKDVKNERIESSTEMEDVNEDEDYISEIDRKADEFISKFKEQIRLQKVASRRESSKHQT